MDKNNIILLHGALGTKAQLDPLKNILTDHFNVFSLNFEGHGNRTSELDFSIDQFANNVVTFLKENNISKTHIFGYSMGGYVGLYMALKKPELVGKIISLGTKFNWTKEIAEREVKMLNPIKIEEKIPAFAKKLEDLHTSNDWKVMMKKTAHLMSGLGNGKGLSDDDLSHIAHDTLITIGTLDNMVSIDESTHASNILPNGKLKIIDNFKHPIEKVDMTVLANLILDFIKS